MNKININAVAEQYLPQYYFAGGPFEMFHRKWYRINAGNEVEQWIKDTYISDIDYRYPTEPNYDEIFVTDEVFIFLQLKFA